MSSRTIGSLMVRLGMDPKDADKALKKFEKDLVATGRKMEAVGRTMSIGFTAPFVLGIRHAVKAASDAEETFSKFGVVYSKVSKEAEKSFQTLRKEYGLSSTTSKKLLSDTGDLLTGFGFSQEAALDLSTQVNKLAVDLASFTNFSGGAEGASQALTKALLGERESVKSLGIAILESDVKARVALLTSQGITFETERQAKAYATLQIALEQSKNAQGDYARTQDSFANQARLLKERVNDLAVSFGQILLPIAQKVVKSLQGLVEWFEKLSTPTKEYILKIGGLVALSGPVLILAGNFIKLALAVQKFNGTKGGFVVMMAALKAGMNSLLDKGAETIAGGAKQSYLEGGSAAGYRAKMYGAALTSGIGGQYGQAIDYAKQMFGGLPAYTNSSQFGGTDLLLGSAAQSQNNGFLAPPALSGGGSKIINHGGGGGGTRNASDFLVPDDFGSPIGMEGSMMSSFSPSGFNPITAALPGLDLKGIEGTFDRILPKIDDVASGFSGLKDNVLDFGSVFGAAMGSIIGSLEEGGASFGEYAANAVVAIAKVIQAKMMELAINVVSGEAAKGGLVGALVGLAGATAVIALVGKLMSSQKPPALATGGVAYGPTMAMVGDNPNAHVDPEVISPLSKLKGMMGNGGGMNQMQIVGVIRGDDILLQTSKAQGRAVRRGSGNVITF